MGELVQYRLEDSIAIITMDDGKVNALSADMLAQLSAAFDRAAADRACVVLTGREGVLSAGFDLATFRAGGAQTWAMLRAGFELSERMLSFPLPVTVACTGHALAMGLFLLLSADYRVGTTGPYKLSANEVAIGITLPHAAIEICRQRLPPAHLSKALLLAHPYTPDTALDAGFLDRVVPADELAAAAKQAAAGFAKLNLYAHGASKLRLREPTLKAMRAGLEADEAEFRALVGL